MPSKTEEVLDRVETMLKVADTIQPGDVPPVSTDAGIDDVMDMFKGAISRPLAESMLRCIIAKAFHTGYVYGSHTTRESLARYIPAVADVNERLKKIKAGK